MIGLIKGTMRSKKALAGLPLPIASFRTNGNSPLTACKVSITPVQAGSGDPYPAGGGKNKLSCTATTVTQDGVTFTVHADGTISTSNTASTTTVFTVGSFNVTNGTTYILNGLPADGSNTTFGFQIKRGNYALNNDYSASGNSYTAEADETLTVAIVIRSGYNASGMLFKPMIRLSTVTDGTFAPYSNIRPISGWDSVKVSATGKNLFGNKPFSNWVSVGSYKALKNILPNNQSMIMSFSDNDNTVDVSGIYFGFLSSSWSGTGGTAPALSDYRWVISNGVIGANKTNTSVSGGNLLNSVFIYPNTEEAYNKLFARYYVQVELGSSATTYEPFGQTATIPLPHTVYGGELDVVSGSGSEEWGMIKLSDLDWTGIASNPPVFRAVLSSIPNIQAPASNTTVTTAFTESFSAMSYTAITSSNIGKFAISATVSNRVVFIDDSVATLEAFLAKYGNDKLVYPLATPTALTTSPVALQARNGQNNVWADAGDISELKFIEHHQYIGR